ncbi:tripartite motif-containing protein 40 [Choloepus didactylus]|uniref:tripartite motif-containing protein 40 n=1 Tax=Choloepus didactylus TaxID=27675 RepID=UPI00189F0855|nr:tripartite motif-containing protein 40 [Choloepus didactylus]XP_037700743.1 tripartite motif-containing protein 40 [Choloepus didactylus]
MVPLQKDIQEESICPICQEHPKEAVSTNCKHLFCRVCLANHVKALGSGNALHCPICRKPCSEEVLGAGYVCQLHQKKVNWFCEDSCLLLCVECLASPECHSHQELTIEKAISHYKERLTRRIRKLKKDLKELQQLKAQEEKKLQDVQVDLGSHPLAAELESQHQAWGQWEDLPQQPLGLLEDISRAIMQHNLLITDMERMARDLDASMLKDASDLLNRSDLQKLKITGHSS